MAGFRQVPKPILKIIHYPPQIMYAVGLGVVLGKFVLLLTTIGRSSGKKRVTPLQYEEIDNKIYLGSALGLKADWVRNIIKNPVVEIQVKSKKFNGKATIIDDSNQIIEFILIRYKRHPKMIGRILKSEGISLPPTTDDLKEYVKEMVVVIINPTVIIH